MTGPSNTPKKKSFIRWEAILPITIIVVLISIYFKFFFDGNLKRAFEFAGYRVLGAEVNIENVETSFIHATFRLKGLELTDSDKPKFNSISIGDIRFSMLWDGLLRGKVVINEVAVERVEFGKPRKSPGKVLPPEPVVVKEAGPSKLQQEAEKLKDQALNKTKENYKSNVLGDVASLLGGTDSKVQIDKIEGTLTSKNMAQKLEAEIKAKTQIWQDRLKSLPQGKDFQSLGDRLAKVKTKDFKSVNELQDSLKEIDSLVKEAEAKTKQIQAANTDLNQDLNLTQKQIKELDEQIKTDIKTLESRFKIPRLDPKSISQALFRQYLDPYLAKFNHYKKLADKYVPPNVMKKDKADEADLSMQPRPREKGVVYEFGRLNSYPGFWVQRVSVSSQAGLTPYSGNIKGEITDITTNQVLIGRPTVAKFSGDFPSAELMGLDSKLVVDNRSKDSHINFDFNIGGFPIDGRELVNSNEVQISFKKAAGKMKIQSELVALKNFKMSLNNSFTQVQYDIKATNSTVDEILKNVFAGIPVVTLDAQGWGELPDLSLSIDSNLGTELSKGIEKQIQSKINEAQEKIKKYVADQVGAQRAQIEAQFKQIKDQVDREIKKVQDQSDAQKKVAESKVDQAKKDSENQGKKKVEEEAKRAAEDLKKKLGW